MSMTEWDTIACTRGHVDHATRLTDVDLSRTHRYFDLAQIPRDLQVKFSMFVWDWTRYTSGGYCPAADVVSETIATCGIWEPGESALVLDACRSADDSYVIDFGAHVGWFTMLAALSGVPVLAIEADPACAELVEKNARLNYVEDFVEVRCSRIGPESPPLTSDKQVRLLKADVEGAEIDVIRVAWPLLEAGRVDYLLLEITPTFADYYPALVRELANAGYVAHRCPPKRHPPHPFEHPLEDVKAFRLDPSEDIAAWHQEDCFFIREDLL